MIEICLGAIAILILLVIYLLRRMSNQKAILVKTQKSLEDRATEAANLRVGLERRKTTHAQNLEDTRRHFDRRIEEEKRKVSLEWTAKLEKTIAQYKDELRKQSREIRAHYEEQVETLRADFREHHRVLLSSVEDLIEPATTGDCFKVRCHTDDEGVLFARKFEAQRRFPEGSFKHYRCRVCPRNPISGERYIHIFTADPKLKMIMTDAPTYSLVHPREQLAARFTPGDLANLRRRIQAEDS